MKCLVAVKRVIDFNVKVRVKSDGTGVETVNVKMSMNPFDEIAIEEAVRQKEAGFISEVIAISIGTLESTEILRAALARGADRAILVEDDATRESINIAKILSCIAKREEPTFIILGKQAIDNDCNQTGQMLAGLLGWSQGTFASKIVIQPKEKTVLVTREVDGGLETLSLKMPVVLTTDLRLNEPRYMTLPNIMKAKQKPIQKITLQELGVDCKQHLKVLQVESPEIRRVGKEINSVSELVDKLKNEAHVL